MSSSFDLWGWFESSQKDPSLRAGVIVSVLAADGTTEQVRFVMKGCLPLKVKAPPLNAKDGMVAIEELQIAYGTLSLKAPNGGNRA
jgi:phage tail-like protein